MTRDTRQDLKHFHADISQREKSHNKRLEKLKKGQIKTERLIPVKQAMAANMLGKVVAKYSAGESIVDMKEDLGLVADLISESWIEGNRKFHYQNKVLDAYVIDAYTTMLRVLSLGVLLRMPTSFFEQLSLIVRNDKVIDDLFEFIFNSQIDLWEVKSEKIDYKFSLYKRVKESVKTSDKNISEHLIKNYLFNDWLEEQKKSEMITDPDKAWYSGCWSFESAVIVAILDLDDSKFRENEYYPKDLVDYYRANQPV
jgi:hypothetical protein